ncbi:peptidase M28 [Saccharopolyspora erythraea D]|nr:peptidase M28 [Saccharopolyspora erythraea D]
MFFDLGDTLASVAVGPDGRTIVELKVFDDVRPILDDLRELGCPLGLISNPGAISHDEVDRWLHTSDLASVLEPELIVLGRKDSPRLFRTAARLAGDPSVATSVFVGEDATERAFAREAGFRVAPHPRLARAVVESGGPLTFLRATVPEGGAWAEAFDRCGAVACDVTPGPPTTVLGVGTSNSVQALEGLGWRVERLGGPGLPATTDLYLIRDLDVSAVGVLGRKLGDDNAILASTGQDVLLAVPGGSEVEDLHLAAGQHGHNLKLTPLSGLGKRPVDLGREPAVATGLGTAALERTEADVLERTVTATRVQDIIARYTGGATADGPPLRSRHILHADNATAVDRAVAELAAMDSMVSVRRHRFSHQGRAYENVEGELPGSGLEGVVVISAHLDSTAARQPGFRAASDPAPGADDDGSGLAGVLAAADAVCRLARTLGSARRTVRFVLFNAEEHGLVGSRAYARDQAAQGVPITAVFQMDMIGWDARSGRSWELHAGFSGDRDVERASQALGKLVAEEASAVSPDLLAPQRYGGTIADPAETRSDHHSFHLHGRPACLASEDFFIGPDRDSEPDANPNYHLPADKAVEVDFIADIARAVTAAAWVTATRPAR